MRGKFIQYVGKETSLYGETIKGLKYMIQIHKIFYIVLRDQRKQKDLTNIDVVLNGLRDPTIHFI
jgi:hypothetical protein